MNLVSQETEVYSNDSVNDAVRHFGDFILFFFFCWARIREHQFDRLLSRPQFTRRGHSAVSLFQLVYQIINLPTPPAESRATLYGVWR